MLRFAFISVVLAACGGTTTPKPDNDPFDTFQLCYNEHHVSEMFSTPCAIEICCIDHPIGPGATMLNVVCGTTAAACSSYVGSNLTDSSDTMLQSDIATACQHYTVDGEHGGSGSGGMCGS